MAYTRHIPSPIMHRVVSHGETLYFGGMVAEDRSQGMAGQTEQILKRMEAMLLECGSARTKVLAATIFVTNLSLKKEMDEVWVGFLARKTCRRGPRWGSQTWGVPIRSSKLLLPQLNSLSDLWRDGGLAQRRMRAPRLLVRAGKQRGR